MCIQGHLGLDNVFTDKNIQEKPLWASDLF